MSTPGEITSMSGISGIKPCREWLA